MLRSSSSGGQGFVRMTSAPASRALLLIVASGYAEIMIAGICSVRRLFRRPRLFLPQLHNPSVTSGADVRVDLRRACGGVFGTHDLTVYSGSLVEHAAMPAGCAFLVSER